ncbi:uncharacterized protein Z518_05103 [Rhinocladiella mackenziei CBS 650.93]|uniref:Zn(2)-C6 fungal-type domain-containing protein n=1 Tax=Rhinocladiella mackenziei CBS 650.93 TaxID=1442369 RepID=A0A0D2IVB5_9EURO|nr:uncharacterized protein Z518_05103 [Rhinocladiella mackenziei CBS 650.93]KIX07126.1 hypothetical protein Z518_05103 [Rhinocladiella mackenziei CBS 650.93]
MAPTRNARGFRRVLQACENCRRKKTRCPGEKPRCSNCTRLRQTCHYSGSELISEQPRENSGRNLEDRLAQLEEKMEMILDRPRDSPRQGETPHSTRERSETAFITSPAAQISSVSCSSLLPSKEVITKAIDIYFLCSHRQPLWLFDPADALSPDSCEELVFAVLGLSVQYAPDDFVGAQIQAPEAYNAAARSLIMLRMANATVNFSTLQALCLLAFSNLVSNDCQLAALHATLVKNLLQCSGVDSQLGQDRTPVFEEQRRLFWSVSTLDSLCGLQVKVPSLLDDIHNPRYLAVEGMLQQTTAPCPLLPQDLYTDDGEKSIGIWGHMVRSATLWGEVRNYVSRCAEGQVRAPWQPTSGYTIINSHLLDMECAFPTSYRYDSAKFVEHTNEEIFEKRQFWLPWMKIQITYHTIHSVLNHPFLYSSRASKPRPGPNAFWRTSTDLALLHSTWIARLIGMANKKGLKLADPYFAHAAAVAVTLHSYWSRATDSRIRVPAVNNLEICRSFITEMGCHWPICRSIAENLDQLVNLALPTEQPEQARSTNIATNTSLMWKILDFAAPRRSSFSGKSSFESSFQDTIRFRDGSQDQATLEDPELQSPPGDIQNSTGEYSAPPDWFSTPNTSTSPQIVRQMAEGPSEEHQEELAAAPGGQSENPQNLNLPEPSNWTWGPGDANITYDPWTQFYDRAGAHSGWWDFGNL